jgi:hypothetical protein
MPDFDAGTGDIGQLDIDRLGLEARQFLLDQYLQHLPGQKQLGPPLRVDDRQHAAPFTRHWRHAAPQAGGTM